MEVVENMAFLLRVSNYVNAVMGLAVAVLYILDCYVMSCKLQCLEVSL